IVDMLLGGELDAAWICGLPYIERKGSMSLVAVPLYIGVPLYRSYLIVNKDDTATQSWKDLPKGVFAFSDRDSNSGWLYPQWAMQQAGVDVKTHFRKTFLAGAHRNVVEAVAEGLADAGSVDGYVWDTLNRDNPSLTTRTRIVEKSETFGFPPIVARNELPDVDKQTLRKALIDMASDSEGRRLLYRLNLDGFVEVEPSLYDNIAEMSRSLGRMP
ncbi:MAG: PhnD/SsuA/transferrin family substrate-binding protein, partial [Planctomycetia bacterium]|nr:PhnD/SsuA/transferrin family substrate-binding protein [Planctomycetia bacterium]